MQEEFFVVSFESVNIIEWKEKAIVIDTNTFKLHVILSPTVNASLPDIALKRHTNSVCEL